MTDIITINDIDNYTLEFKNGKLILTPKYVKITLEEARNLQLAHCVIDKCMIFKNDETISTSTKFRRILIDLWKSMPTQLLLMNTTYNMKLTNENGNNGYNWVDDVNVSAQDKDSHGAFKEMLKLVEINKYKMILYITLITNRKVLIELV
jgi:hypothetical protein